MITYTEIEFVCSNAAFEGTCSPEQQDSALKELQFLGGVLPYKQVWGTEMTEQPQSSLAVIVLDRDNVKTLRKKVIAIGKLSGLTVDVIQQVSNGYVDRLVKLSTPGIPLIIAGDVK